MHRALLSSARQFTIIALLLCLISSLSFGATHRTRHRRRVSHATRATIQNVSLTRTRVHATSLVARTTRTPGPIIQGGPWTKPTFADSTDGDNVDGEDLTIRRAAVD